MYKNKNAQLMTSEFHLQIEPLSHYVIEPLIIYFGNFATQTENKIRS